MSISFQEGSLLLVNKPLEWTSFDVIKKLRILLKYELGIKKIKAGHSGTLDPLATGLLVVCTGKFTKRLHEFQDLGKEYEGVITLGATTPSFDLETAIDQTFPTGSITEEEILNAAHQLTGTIDQEPPLFSAKKVEGKKAYELAREGKKMAMKKQKVEITSFVIEKIEMPDIHFRIACSKGTYIRSIARDFGKVLGNGAHLSRLKRTMIGNYHIKDALDMEGLEKTIREQKKLLPLH